MTRTEMIREWRADVPTLFAWACGAAVLVFVILCAAAVLDGWLRSRRHRLHRKSDHIGRKES